MIPHANLLQQTPSSSPSNKPCAHLGLDLLFPLAPLGVLLLLLYAPVRSRQLSASAAHTSEELKRRCARHHTGAADLEPARAGASSFSVISQAKVGRAKLGCMNSLANIICSSLPYPVQSSEMQHSPP